MHLFVLDDRQIFAVLFGLVRVVDVLDDCTVDSPHHRVLAIRTVGMAPGIASPSMSPGSLPGRTKSNGAGEAVREPDSCGFVESFHAHRCSRCRTRLRIQHRQPRRHRSRRCSLGRHRRPGPGVHSVRPTCPRRTVRRSMFKSTRRRQARAGVAWAPCARTVSRSSTSTALSHPSPEHDPLKSPVRQHVEQIVHVTCRSPPIAVARPFERMHQQQHAAAATW